MEGGALEFFFSCKGAVVQKRLGTSDLDQTGPSMFTKRSKTVKEKTGKFHCIVDTIPTGDNT
jgi:hypothetical protein